MLKYVTKMKVARIQKTYQKYRKINRKQKKTDDVHIKGYLYDLNIRGFLSFKPVLACL